ncbi:WW domain-containing protein wwm1 [Exophiala dermatitidis]|uniref:WW domain-containing protein n=2 Tax=Exophiala dermatitidis TaxID=5970 RepID=H6BVJ3_EXODN|nr:uncharacterized protein HMPREF1120_03208 [Exophiala dermatitidis NIH/UT8656]KAJ4508036.1 WW domain-containing protein wwm1 [Exophiala dermatitidis]EHY55052.1 hypothetical protein HMPREF1120_03208 [Exophiala dermatitidis NIH/UT8656]KAJ4510857.1 WW domain-containing protein wwm1 [Exophiala dermatitidis]KAJ4513250.1 WW domain-containing protein wwm1 [Exophiala dermatitidis]KAJ4532033.1 WW domain-containing protein wwm1 [Exophiala dermatitidis]
MADFVPPPGPPPPKVPEGWKAVWNDQYKEWFYVNLYTKQSQWEKPTEPARPPNSSHDDAPPGVPPPSYSAGDNAPHASDTKRPLESNNPYNGQRRDGESDEQYARRLQDEENSKHNRGAADEFYNSGTANPPGIQGGYPGAPGSSSSSLPPRPESSSGSGKSKGFLGKLLGKSSSSSHSQQQYAAAGGYPAGYGQQQGYPPQGGYYPPQGTYGGYPPQGYPAGYGGGYGGGYAAAPPRRTGGGLGAGGAAALGLGGGLLGGMMLESAIDAGDGGDYGGDGGDFGGDGGDFGGGDF